MGLNGFSACQRSAIGTYRIPGTNRAISVRRETAAQFLGFAAEFHEKVEPINVGRLDDWSYACRKQRGGSVISFHAIGGAIDLNALRHPMGVRGTFSKRQVATIRVLCRKYKLKWGGDFRRRADEMHFEQTLGRSAAIEFNKKLLAPAKSRASRSQPRKTVVPRLAKLAYGAENSDIVLMQKALVRQGYKIDTDGIYGPKTKAAVASFQQKQGWSKSGSDGLMGPLTLKRLF